MHAFLRIWSLRGPSPGLLLLSTPIPNSWWCTGRARSSTTRRALFSAIQPCCHRLGLMVFVPTASSASRPWFSAARWGCCLERLISSGARPSISAIGLGPSKLFPIELATSPSFRVKRICTVRRSPPSNALKWLWKQRICWRATSVLQMPNACITMRWSSNLELERCRRRVGHSSAATVWGSTLLPDNRCIG